MKPFVPGDILLLPRASFLLLYRDPRDRWSSQVNEVPRPTLLTCLATRDFPCWPGSSSRWNPTGWVG